MIKVLVPELTVSIHGRVGIGVDDNKYYVSIRVYFLTTDETIQELHFGPFETQAESHEVLNTEGRKLAVVLKDLGQKMCNEEMKIVDRDDSDLKYHKNKVLH